MAFHGWKCSENYRYNENIVSFQIIICLSNELVSVNYKKWPYDGNILKQEGKTRREDVTTIDIAENV